MTSENRRRIMASLWISEGSNDEQEGAFRRRRKHGHDHRLPLEEDFRVQRAADVLAGASGAVQHGGRGGRRPLRERAGAGRGRLDDDSRDAVHRFSDRHGQRRRRHHGAASGREGTAKDV